MTDRPHDSPDITDEELSAYIDGELSSVRAADITALAQYDPNLARRIAGFRDDKTHLTELYGPLITQPLPAAWLHTIEQAHRRATLPSLRPMLALAASLVLIVLALSTYALVKPDDRDVAIAEAMTARHESLVMTAASNVATSPEVADQTIQTVLGAGVRTPDLSKLGYHLAAAHTLADGKVATLDYTDGRNRMFTVVLRRSPGTERFDMVKHGALRICIWQDDVLSAVMLGDMSAGEMLRLATLAYAGLSAA